MLNQTVLVGRLVSKPEIKGEEKKYATITLAVPRSYKNEEGIYDTDFISATLFGSVATNTVEYCNKGDVVGIKGRLQTTDDKLELIAEKVTFLSSKKEDE